MKPGRVRPLSHLKSRAAELIRNIVESREPMLITRSCRTCSHTRICIRRLPC